MDPTKIILPGLGDPAPGLYVLSRSVTKRLESLRIPVATAEDQSLIQALGSVTKQSRGVKYLLHRALFKQVVISVVDLSHFDDGSARILHSTPDELLTRVFHRPKLLSRATEHDTDLLVHRCRASIACPDKPHPQQAILLHWKTDRAAAKTARCILTVLSLAIELSSICIG
ncbi:uncharacterized protein PG998_011615 [Apiospora kogelbergensis]|uniref:uncharacterized protein n=1 Tax=Apiospora kogelbergensis TaxID=1337665 RepID=UPI00312EB262